MGRSRRICFFGKQDIATPKVYILAGDGDSGMVGRANEKTTPPDSTDPRILQLNRDNTVSIADDPLPHNDGAQAANSIGVLMSFARALLLDINPEDTILIVPDAQGGSSYGDGGWVEGGALFESLIARVNYAISLHPNNYVLIRTTILGGQDGADGNHLTYAANSDANDLAFRTRVTGDNYEMLHLMVGIIPAFYNSDPNILHVRNEIADVENRLINSVYVPWEDGVSISGVDLHPDGASSRTMGARLNEYRGNFVATPEPVPTVLPDVPTGLSATAQQSAALLGWTAAANAQSYVVEYKLDTASNWTVISNVQGNSHTISGLTNTALYNVKIKSRNVVGDSASTATVNVTPVSLREVGAEIHHLFGTDYATMEDLNTGGALTAVGVSPNAGAGYTATTGAIPNGIRSAVAHSSTGKTVIAVVKVVDNANHSILLGNLTPTAGDGGWGVYEFNGDLGINFRGAATDSIFKAGLDYDNYVFIAISMDDDSHLCYYDDSEGGKSTYASTGVVDSSSIDIGVGNTEYGTGAYTNGCFIAEFIVFDSALTEVELDAVKARSTTRLAARGITV